eukprot:95100-Prymnesium_polylepis.1
MVFAYLSRHVEYSGHEAAQSGEAHIIGPHISAFCQHQLSVRVGRARTQPLWACAWSSARCAFVGTATLDCTSDAWGLAALQLIPDARSSTR